LADANLNLAEPLQGVIPALGISWTHFVNIRIILQYLNDFQREVKTNLYFKVKIHKILSNFVYILASCSQITASSVQKILL
jgi:hypothetical protein